MAKIALVLSYQRKKIYKRKKGNADSQMANSCCVLLELFFAYYKTVFCSL